MSIMFKSNKVEKAEFNGLALHKIIFNGETVYSYKNIQVLLQATKTSNTVYSIKIDILNYQNLIYDFTTGIFEGLKVIFYTDDGHVYPIPETLQALNQNLHSYTRNQTVEYGAEITKVVFSFWINDGTYKGDIYTYDVDYRDRGIIYPPVILNMNLYVNDN